MIDVNDHILVAVSGGVDSMVLLHVLIDFKDEFNLTLEVAHLNHGIRDEAETDLEFVREQTVRLNLPFHAGHNDVPKLSSDTKQSLEAAARQARYEFLEDTAEKSGCNKIALGHHKNDQAETVLMNLFRGAGPPGLAGMPVQRGPHIRPLLNVGRADIEQYADENQIPFREDESNQDEHFTRNRLRHSIFPLLEELNPNILETLIRTQTHMRQLVDYAYEASTSAFKSLLINQTGGEIILDRKQLQQLSPALQTGVVRHAFSELSGDAKGLDTRHFQYVLKHSGSDEHGQLLEFPRGRRIFVDQNQLYFFQQANDPGAAPPLELVLPGETIWGKWRLTATLSDYVENKAPSLQNWRVCLDWHTIKPPLKVRIRQPGDRIQPLGLDGHKKIQDIFVDAKVPRYKRDNVPIVVDANGPIWIVGHCLSERVRITSSTQEVLILEAQ